VSRVRRFSPWVLGMLAAALLDPASGQNLDAGKPASQIFAEACASCHRSPRELRSNLGVTFLREHYTTGSDMASTMAAYLSSPGGEPRAAGVPQPKRPPNPVGPVAPATSRDAPAPDPSRERRRAQQTRPGSVRTEGTAEVKPPEPSPPAAPPPAPPPLEEFEE
jgi:hypothetical protein